MTKRKKMSIGKKIKRLRLDAEMTQEDLAHAAGVSWSTIQRIESDVGIPHPLTMNAIAKALKCKPDELRGM
jgi:transcriptional regulator with XRE-family HTH domain